jgi:hypothetical protein
VNAHAERRLDLEELAFARHLADALEPGTWAVAGPDERDRFRELARAALDWGGVDPYGSYQAGVKAGREAGYQAARADAFKEAEKIIRKALREAQR